MTPPPLPSLRARNRLAEAILDALHDAAARRMLSGLADDEMAVRDRLGPDATGDGGEPCEPPHGPDRERRGERRVYDAVRERARCASATVAAVPLGGPARGLPDALADAALLFDAGLFFETHELLEPHWRQASGEAREVLQGLIQIAVGYQHHVNGNAPGARSLLVEGATRVRGHQLMGMSLDDFADAVARTIGLLGGPTPGPLAAPPFPRQATPSS
jgi:Domain of unknown function (DUF309)